MTADNTGTSPRQEGQERREPDGRAAVRRDYARSWARFAKVGVPFGVLWAASLVIGAQALLPVAIVGFFGFAVPLALHCQRLLWTWRCGRVLRRYPLVFRGPVDRVQRTNQGLLVFRFTDTGAGSSGVPIMQGVQNMKRDRWPRGFEDGVWFAGDEVFGGAAVVPATGELVWMQPRDWGRLKDRREEAGPERRRTARRAGIGRRVSPLLHAPVG